MKSATDSQSETCQKWFASLQLCLLRWLAELPKSFSGMPSWSKEVMIFVRSCWLRRSLSNSVQSSRLGVCSRFSSTFSMRWRQKCFSSLPGSWLANVAESYEGWRLRDWMHAAGRHGPPLQAWTCRGMSWYHGCHGHASFAAWINSARVVVLVSFCPELWPAWWCPLMWLC